MRVRGEILSFMDGVHAPGVLVDMALGMIVMPEGTGTTVTSSPISDANAPWFFYHRWTLGHEEAVTDVIGVQGILFMRTTIDSKAMRILRPDREVQTVIEQVNVGSGGSTNTRMNIRVLFGST